MTLATLTRRAAITGRRGASGPATDLRLAVVVLNYRRAELTIGCLESLEPEVSDYPDRHVVVVDNASDDDSADVLERTIADRGWSAWATLVRSPVNGGFAAGNNIGFCAAQAEAYVLLNSDARVRPGALDDLLEVMDRHPEAGLIGPRLEDPDGTPQVSCFRFRTPVTEMLEAASTGPLSWLFRGCLVATGVHEASCEPKWVSFACVLIRREVVDRIGPMDESYFMYFEDIDYARRARRAGFGVRHDPGPRVVHLRGGTSSVKSAMAERDRIPRYYFESRSRYFAKFYGGIVGLLVANALWQAGRILAWMREVIGHKTPHQCADEWKDNWINWWDPMRSPAPPEGGEQ